jgi:hypothetical protein
MELDVLELVGIAASLIATLFVMRWAVPADEANAALRLAALVGLLAVTVGPFVARSVRRGRGGS